MNYEIYKMSRLLRELVSSLGREDELVANEVVENATDGRNDIECTADKSDGNAAGKTEKNLEVFDLLRLTMKTLERFGEQFMDQLVPNAITSQQLLSSDLEICQSPPQPSTSDSETCQRSMQPSAAQEEKCRQCKVTTTTPNRLDMKGCCFEDAKSSNFGDEYRFEQKTLKAGEDEVSTASNLSEINPIWSTKRKFAKCYNVSLLLLLSILMFMTGVQYNISQMIAHHQSCQWLISRTTLSVEPSVLVALISCSTLFSGVLSDKFGRKTVLIGVVYALSLGILISGTAGNVYQYMAGRFIIGISIGALFNLCIVIWMESSPCHLRRVGVLVLMVFSALGHASIVVFDSLIMNSYGWNWGMMSTLGIMVPLIVQVHLSHETPLYLLAAGSSSEAAEVAHYCNMTDSDTVGNDTIEQRGNIKEIFSSRYFWITISLIICFGVHRLVEVGLIFGVPHLLAMNYCNEVENIVLNQTMPTDESCWRFTYDDYIFILAFALLGIPGFFIGALLQMDFLKLPVKYSITLLSLLVGGVLAWCAVCDYYWLLEFKLGILRVFISGQDQIFSVIIPAVFPTHIRNSGSGFIRSLGIMISSLGPFLTIWLFNVSVMSCFIIHAVLYCGRIPLAFKVILPSQKRNGG